MSNPTSRSPSEPQLSAGSINSTPESDGVTTPKDSQGQGDQQVTPQPKKVQGSTGADSQWKSRMAPPPLPIKITQPTPPKMARLPSLQQISSRLNPGASPTISGADGVPPSAGGSAPKLSLSTNVPPSASVTSPFASSPSGRLKMPISAMKRTQSQQGNTTPLAESSTASSFFNTTEPFASPAPKTASAATHMTAGHSVPAPPPPLSRGMSVDGFIKGYKDVPSLAQISKHVNAKVSTGGADKEKEIAPVSQSIKEEGASKEGISASTVTDQKNEAPSIVEPKTEERIKSESGEHPLEHTWVLFFDSKTCKPDSSLVAAIQDKRPMLNDYEKTLVKIGTIDTVESFARHFNNIRLPGSLTHGANYHLFQKGIVPMWEDPANSNGGKWILLFKGGATCLMDLAWAQLTMGLIGGILDPDNAVTGIVASNRAKIDRVQVWTRSKGDSDAEAEAINGLGRRISDFLALSGRDLDLFSMEFQHNSGSGRPPDGKFFKIPFASERSSFSTPNAPSTPSRLGTSHLPYRPDASPTHRDNAALPSLNSPTPSNGRLAPPGGPEPMRRIGSGQGMGAFSGPMGGMPSRSGGGNRMGVAGGR